MKIFAHCPEHGPRPNKEHPLCRTAADVNRLTLKKMHRTQRKYALLSALERAAAYGQWR
jgi:hypothetical protein